jgi:hypothetical protein
MRSLQIWQESLGASPYLICQFEPMISSFSDRAAILIALAIGR